MGRGAGRKGKREGGGVGWRAWGSRRQSTFILCPQHPGSGTLTRRPSRRDAEVSAEDFGPALCSLWFLSQRAFFPPSLIIISRRKLYKVEPIFIIVSVHKNVSTSGFGPWVRGSGGPGPFLSVVVPHRHHGPVSRLAQPAPAPSSLGPEPHTLRLPRNHTAWS